MAISISTLVAVAKQAASTAPEAMTLFKTIRASPLSPEEKELLAAAASEGQFMLIEAEQLPTTLICVGRLNFPADAEASDPASFARYLEAFHYLIQRKCVEPDGGSVFKLTSVGFERARKLITD